jgi:predicted DNA-binding transcriptional regulator AlpA
MVSIYKERKRQLNAAAAEAIKNVPGIESVRVLKRNELLVALDIDKSTLDRMEAHGEGPPKTQLSPKRIGYRIADVARWLDSRRKSSAEVQPARDIPPPRSTESRPQRNRKSEAPAAMAAATT